MSCLVSRSRRRGLDSYLSRGALTPELGRILSLIDWSLSHINYGPAWFFTRNGRYSRYSVRSKSRRATDGSWSLV